MRNMRIGAAWLAAITLLAAACTGGETSDTTGAPEPTVEPEQTATTAPPTTSASDSDQIAFNRALATKDAFFIAFNSGDFEGVMELFAADADFGEDGRSWFEELLAWNIAQGTRYTPSNCRVSEGEEPNTVKVDCPYKTHDGIMVVLATTPVPFNATFEMVDGEIVSYSDRFGQPDFRSVGVPFGLWMEEHHPDDVEQTDFASWTTLDEATEFGAVRAEYALLWAAYLEENGCAYNEGC